MTEPTPEILVLGIGNLLNTDEGVGVHAVKELQVLLADTPGVLAHDGGTLGLNLLPLVEDHDYVLLLDAVDAGADPGTVIELADDDIPVFGGAKLSQHQLTFQEVLGLALVREKYPSHLHLIGVQPLSLEIGVGMSDPVKATLPTVIQLALRRLAGWGVAIPEHVGIHPSG